MPFLHTASLAVFGSALSSIGSLVRVILIQKRPVISHPTEERNSKCPPNTFFHRFTSLFFALAGTKSVLAEDGSLDLTFGNGGMVTTDFGSSDFSSAMVVQLDGNNYDFALVRYNTDGSLDLSFDLDGSPLDCI